MQDSIFMESAAKWFDALAPEVVRKPPLPRWRCVTISHLAVASCVNDWRRGRGAGYTREQYQIKVTCRITR
jgi:hypothetical protein